MPTTFESTDQGIDYWASRPYLNAETQARLRQVEVVLLPREGFRGQDLLTFPVRTEEFYKFLKQELGDAHPVNLAIDDKDYKELALHAGLIELGTILVGSVLVPLLVNVISDYINRRAETTGKIDEPTVRVELIVQEQTPEAVRTTKLSYDGPAKDFLPSMKEAIQKAPGLALPDPKQQALSPMSADANA